MGSKHTKTATILLLDEKDRKRIERLSEVQKRIAHSIPLFVAFLHAG